MSPPDSFPVEIVDELDSTNRALSDRARAGGLDPVLLVARHQTSGRGRLGRTWEAPPGSAFTGSWLIPVDQTMWAEQPWLLSVAVALAVYDTLLIDLAIPAARVVLKWPNDVMVPPLTTEDRDRKLCGILAEFVGGHGSGAVIVGAGLNVQRPAVVEGVLAERGIWLSDLMGTPPPSVDKVITLLNGRLWARLHHENGPVVRTELVSAYQVRCATVGQRVRVEQLTSTFEGRAIAIDTDGALIVQTDANEERRVTVADVVHLHASSKENEA